MRCLKKQLAIMIAALGLWASCVQAASWQAQLRADVQPYYQTQNFELSDAVATHLRAWGCVWLDPAKTFAVNGRLATLRSHDLTVNQVEAWLTYRYGLFAFAAGGQQLTSAAAIDRTIVQAAISYRTQPRHFVALTWHRDTTIHYSLLELDADYELPRSRHFAYQFGGRVNYLSYDDAATGQDVNAPAGTAFRGWNAGELWGGVNWQAVRPSFTVEVLPYGGLRFPLTSNAREQQHADRLNWLFGVRLYLWIP